MPSVTSKISRIFIACYKGDVRLTRICVASIRHWYPEILITLIKDYSWGRFPTGDICRRWKVNVLDTGGKAYGWGLSKLEPLFLPEKMRCLIIDSDIVFLGPVLNRLEQSDADFIVSGRTADTVRPDEIPELYVRMEVLSPMDPTFELPSFFFNSGHFVASTGLFSRDDMSRWIDWTGRAHMRYPKVFPCADQGLLNYWLHRMAQQGGLTLESIQFALWPDTSEVRSLDFEKILATGGIPCLVHWAGLRKPLLRRMIRSDILQYFEDEYHCGRPSRACAQTWLAIHYAFTSYRMRAEVKGKIWFSQKLGRNRVQSLKNLARLIGGRDGKSTRIT